MINKLVKVFVFYLLVGCIFHAHAESKAEKWASMSEKVDLWISLEKEPINQDMRELVIVLNALDIPTEAYFDEKLNGQLFPTLVDTSEIEDLIDDYYDDISPYTEDELDLKIEELRLNYFKSVYKLQVLLNNFYEDRNVPYDQMLLLGIDDNMVLAIEGEKYHYGRKPTELKRKKLEYQKEIIAFVKYLKNEFFTQ